MEDLPGLDRIEYKTNDRTREILERWWNENFQHPGREWYASWLY